MKDVSKFIGIDFRPSMLEVTFNGRQWWGDALYSMTPINDINPTILSSDWKKEIELVDWFVLEGLFYDYIQKYNYCQTSKYVKDTTSSRIKLLLAILVPSRIERTTFLEYLSLFQHAEFIRVAWAEACQKIPLKDYAWSATYLYKWSYKKFKFSNRLEELLPEIHSQVKSFGGTPLCLVPASAYVLVKYLRLLWSIISYPSQIIRRCYTCYKYFFRRIMNSNYYPEMLGYSTLTEKDSTSQLTPQGDFKPL